MPAKDHPMEDHDLLVRLDEKVNQQDRQLVTLRATIMWIIALGGTGALGLLFALLGDVGG